MSLRWGAWGFGMLLPMLVSWALAIALMVYAICWLAGARSASGDSALEILRQRHARGAIHHEELEEKQHALT